MSIGEPDLTISSNTTAPPYIWGPYVSYDADPDSIDKALAVLERRKQEYKTAVSQLETATRDYDQQVDKVLQMLDEQAGKVRELGKEFLGISK